MTMKSFFFNVLFLFSLFSSLKAFKFSPPKVATQTAVTSSPLFKPLQMSSIAIPQVTASPNYDFKMSEAQLADPVDPGFHVVLGGKVLNIVGIIYAISSFGLSCIAVPLMTIVGMFCDLLGQKRRRRPLDWIIHYWANIAMQLVFYKPRIIGAENLPAYDEAVIYCPNHTSLMDILSLSGFINRPFKYLSKEEIKNMPVIGIAMRLAGHVFLRKNDIQSTLECTELTVQKLKDGNSMVLFAEGTRSDDGTLLPFKKGAFQMAKQAGVRIVPVSIGNLHRWMPKNAMLPIGWLKQVYIQIHPPIDTADQPVTKIRKECFEAVNSGLLNYQKSKFTVTGQPLTSPTDAEWEAKYTKACEAAEAATQKEREAAIELAAKRKAEFAA